MADNYIERRMEDLRSGKLSGAISSINHHSSHRKGYLQIRLPELRVLFIGSLNSINQAIIKDYRNMGSKVAVITEDRENGECLAKNNGIRLYPIDLTQTEALDKSILNLLKTWYDIDVIIMSDKNKSRAELIPIIVDRICSNKEKYPLPNSYGGRVIEFFTNPKYKHTLWNSLLKKNFSVVSIIQSENISYSTTTSEDIARLCLFISSPANAFLNGATIEVPCLRSNNMGQ